MLNIIFQSRYIFILYKISKLSTFNLYLLTYISFLINMKPKYLTIIIIPYIGSHLCICNYIDNYVI